ncbi:MAG: hypothetical protein ABIO04_08115 [Ferruginibacter sp.]
MKNSGVVIYVEEDEDDIDIMTRVFKDIETQHELINFRKLESVFEYLQSNIEKPFLIICDSNHFNNNNNKLGKLTRSYPEFRKKSIPFVFFSADTSKALVKEAYTELNVQGFFQKGTSYDKIKEDIQAIIEYWERSVIPVYDVER